MLVLSRKDGEFIEIQLSDAALKELGSLPPEERTISVCVVQIRGDNVRLGFDAHNVVRVHRREVAKRIARDGCERDARVA